MKLENLTALACLEGSKIKPNADAKTASRRLHIFHSYVPAGLGK